MTKNSVQACPCGRSAGKRMLSYTACCGRYVDAYETTAAPDAESLMRSRYSAYVLARADYLLATWDAAMRPPNIDFDPEVKWLGLTIREASTTGPESADVEFVARMRLRGRAQRMHERSHFIRRDGRWYYVDGEMFE